MGELVRIGDIDELTDGAVKKYRVESTELLVAKIDGEYYAVHNKCPHFGGDLSDGELEGTVITCPRHGSQFSLVDGSVVRWLKGGGLVSSVSRIIKKPRGLVTCNIKVDGSDIMVEV